MNEPWFTGTVLADKPWVMLPGLMVSAAFFVLWYGDRRRDYNLLWGIAQVLVAIAAAPLPSTHLAARTPAVAAAAFVLATVLAGFVAYFMGLRAYVGRAVRPVHGAAAWLALVVIAGGAARIDLALAGQLYDAIALVVSLLIGLGLLRMSAAERIAGALMIVRGLNGNYLTALLPAYTLLERVTINNQVSLAIGLALLAAGFLRAVRELAARRAELERMVHERRTQLSATYAELASFASSVSHDLRAPLAELDASSRALEQCGAGLDAAGLDYLRRIRAGSTRMGILIDKLLELAQLSHGALHREQVDLSRLAQLTLERLHEAQPARAVRQTVAPGLRAWADPGLLGIVLDNLLGNAWKYTGRTAQPAIEIGCEGTGRDAVFFVRDNGAGFDMRFADKLFGAFQRLHDAQDFEGTGVGLATVRRIIQRHGGRIWAEAGPGQGATFRFTLPDRHVIEAA